MLSWKTLFLGGLGVVLSLLVLPTLVFLILGVSVAEICWSGVRDGQTAVSGCRTDVDWESLIPLAALGGASLMLLAGAIVALFRPIREDRQRTVHPGP